MDLTLKYLENYDRPAWGDLAYEHSTDAGFDLRAAIPESITLAPGESVTIPAGVAFSVPYGYVVQICSRSGLAANQGVAVLNAPGIIDPLYLGEIKVILINQGKSDFVIEPGYRIAQAVMIAFRKARLFENDQPWLPPQEFVPDDFDEVRGENGLGSTGLL